MLKSIEYSKFWENMSSDFIFHLQKFRYATVVLITSYVACLIVFLKFKQFDGHNFIFRKSRGKIEKSTLKSDFTPNFQYWALVGTATIGDLALLVHNSLVMV